MRSMTALDREEQALHSHDCGCPANTSQWSGHQIPRGTLSEFKVGWYSSHVLPMNSIHTYAGRQLRCWLEALVPVRALTGYVTWDSC